MKKAALVLVFTFIVLTGILLLLLYYYYVQTKPFRNPEKPNIEASQSNIVDLKLDTQLYDLSGKPVPLDIYYDDLEGIIISDIIQEEKIEKEGSLLIAIPDPTDTLKRSILVWTYIGSADNPILLLKLPRFRFGPSENWIGTDNLAELTALLRPGKHVIVHIEQDKDKGEKLVQEAENNYFVELNPVARIIIGI